MLMLENLLRETGRIVDFDGRFGRVAIIGSNGIPAARPEYLHIDYRAGRIPQASLTREHVQLVDPREFHPADNHREVSELHYEPLPVLPVPRPSDFIRFQRNSSEPFLWSAPRTDIRRWTFADSLSAVEASLVKPKLFGLFSDGEEVCRGNRLELSALLPKGRYVEQTRRNNTTFEALNWQRWRDTRLEFKVRTRVTRSEKEIWKHANDERVSYCCIGRLTCDAILRQHDLTDNLRIYLLKQHGRIRASRIDPCPHHTLKDTA